MIKRDELLSKHPGKQNYQGIENFISIPGNRKMIRKRNWSRWDQVFGINCELLHGSIPMTCEANWSYRLNRVISVCGGSLAAETMVTSMLVTDVGDQMCWWQVWDVGDGFRMLVTELIHWENHQHNEKSRQHNDSATNIWNQSPS